MCRSSSLDDIDAAGLLGVAAATMAVAATTFVLTASIIMLAVSGEEVLRELAEGGASCVVDGGMV